MRKLTLFLASFSILISSWLAVPKLALADSTTNIVCDQLTNTIGTNCGQDDLFGSNGLITKIVKLLDFLIGGIALFVLIIAGITFVTSSGNPDSAKKAREAIIYASVGLIVAIIAQFIVLFVLDRIQ